MGERGVDIAILGVDIAILGVDIAVLGVDISILGVDIAILGVDTAVLGVVVPRGCVAARAGGFVRNSGRDRDARSARSNTCIVFPEATSSPARKELREIADRNRRCSNALRVPPPARRVLAAT